MNYIEWLLFICGTVGLLYIIWKIIKAPKLRAASGDHLSRWGDFTAINRIFYGSGCVKPAVACFWDRHAVPSGWYETDADLRKRIIEKMERARWVVNVDGFSEGFDLPEDDAKPKLARREQ